MNPQAPWSTPAVPDGWDGVEALNRRIAKLERINASLMAHVERSMDQHGSAYSLFQTAITLEGQVRSRTEELTELMHSLEGSNDALQAAKTEAERANRSKTRFLAAASHDLLQPVNAARLSLSALSDLTTGREALGIVGQVERGLQTIEDLIKTLIDISKLDAGVIVPSVKPVRLGDLIATIEDSFRPFAERKGLRLVVRCQDLSVQTDPVLLQRVLQNLVSNAIRYTRTGGVLIAARRRGTHARIDVIDTGCGITRAEQGFVFDEFYRGDTEGAEAEAGVGLGLGLSIVRRIVDTLDHTLGLASRLGHGTRMSLRLPLAGDQPDNAVTSSSVATSLTGASVLVIENDASTAEAMRLLLRSWDARVAVHRDLAGIVDAVRGGMSRPDIMVVDYHLDHGAVGLDIVEALRREQGWTTPVIVTTADHSSEIEARVTGSSAQLMHKPVKPAQLRALLAHMLA